MARCCLTPGCPVLVPRGHCAQHAQQREQSRPNADARRWYQTAHWRNLRRMVLAGNPLCVACEADSRITAATDVDHIVPHRGDWLKFADRANLQPLCHRCHSLKTQAEGGHVFGRRYRADRGRFVVSGKANTGKSTWVKAQAKRGDLVWDWDAIVSQVAYRGEARKRMADGSRGFDAPDIVNAMMAMREGLLAWLEKNDTNAQVFVIVHDATRAAAIAARIRATHMVTTEGYRVVEAASVNGY